MANFGHSSSKTSEFVNSGDSDASPDGTPSQFLLIKGLEPTVTEDLLAKGVAKLYKPSGITAQSSIPSSKKGTAKVASTTGDANLGARADSIRRVLLVRDRRTNESWRYGFAEFATVEACIWTMHRGWPVADLFRMRKPRWFASIRSKSLPFRPSRSQLAISMPVFLSRCSMSRLKTNALPFIRWVTQQRACSIGMRTLTPTN